MSAVSDRFRNFYIENKSTRELLVILEPIAEERILKPTEIVHMTMELKTPSTNTRPSFVIQYSDDDIMIWEDDGVTIDWRDPPNPPK